MNLGELEAINRATKATLADRIPSRLLYFPLLVSWIGFSLRHRSLTLPTAANPRHPTPGTWGASSSDYLRDVAAPERRWVADFVVVRFEQSAPSSIFGSFLAGLGMYRPVSKVFVVKVADGKYVARKRLVRNTDLFDWKAAVFDAAASPN